MANNCEFSMRITGGEDEIKELVSLLRREAKVEKGHFGRVFQFEPDYGGTRATNFSGVYEYEGTGDCAFSVKNSLLACNDCSPSLESETRRLGLVVEVFSSEPGCKFQEHILIVKGAVVCYDKVDYEEHCTDCFGGLEAYNEKFGTNFTEAMTNENGDVCIGGFGDKYCVFNDVSQYFIPDSEKSDGEKRSLVDVIKSCEEMSKSSMNTEVLCDLNIEER